MPPRIGSLTCLKTLSGFAVGIQKKGYQLGKLRDVNLYGSIEIRHLERVKNDTEAKEANLSTKGNLHSLIRNWSWKGPHIYESEEVRVIEALKPHPNLTCLTINGFRGFRFPDWMNHSVLRNVVSITIRSCANCSGLPPFGELPCLESLELLMGSLEYVEEGDDVHSGFPTRRRFPSLRKLFIGEFHNLKGLPKKEGEEQFPVLEQMTIFDCHMFVYATLSSYFRDLTSLHIIHNNEVTSLAEEIFKSFPNLKYLKISLIY
uniref:Blight resistance protein SH10 n=1 Tax=Solanum tuberosum TaxID=4113 RepID=M1AJE3_SOLTU